MRKSEKHQLSFPCRHHSHATAPPHSRTYSSTSTHARHHSRAPAPPLAHTYSSTSTHPRRHSRAPAPHTHAPTPALPLMRAITLAHQPHHSHMTAPPLARIRAVTSTHLRLRRCAPAHPLPSRVALAPLVFRTLFYVALRSLVCTFSTNSFKYSYKSF